ncbi:MAG: hypothetical protein AAGJ35_11900 [Myxococcota bacterium]
MVNLTLGYDNVDISMQVAVLYNVFGPRIAEVGQQGAPDIYEQPFHQLDIVFRQRIVKNLLLTFQASNLINLPQIFLQGGRPIRVLHRNCRFSLGIQYQY